MKLQLGPRAQAGVILALVATLGALVGVLGDRALGQQRAAQVEAPVGPPFGPGAAPGMRPGAGGPGGPGMPGMPGMAGRGMAGEVRYAERLATMVDLTDDQHAAIDSIVAEERRRVRALTAELEPRFREIAQDTRRRVEAVLTPAQREQMRAARLQRQRALRGEQVRPAQRLRLDTM